MGLVKFGNGRLDPRIARFDSPIAPISPCKYERRKCTVIEDTKNNAFTHIRSYNMPELARVKIRGHTRQGVPTGRSWKTRMKRASINWQSTVYNLELKYCMVLAPRIKLPDLVYTKPSTLGT